MTMVKLTISRYVFFSDLQMDRRVLPRAGYGNGRVFQLRCCEGDELRTVMCTVWISMVFEIYAVCSSISKAGVLVSDPALY